MTSQRIFPFFVNGQFWQEIEVTEEDLRRGIKFYCVTTRPCFAERSTPDMMATMKKVMFQLAEVIENYPENKPTTEQERGVESFKSFRNHMATWFTGFWVVDKDLYFDRQRLYLKNK